MRRLFSFFVLQRKLTLFLALFWTIGIFIGCSTPGKDLPELHLFDHFDKLVHFTFFAVFFILWYMYFHDLKNIAWIVFFATVVYGFLIEFYQLHFVAGRAFDVWDGIADSIGGILGWFTVKKLSD